MNDHLDSLSHGARWEEYFFGCNYLQFERRDTFLTWGAAVAEVIRMQAEWNWNPQNPHTPFAAELYACIQSYLLPDDRRRLKLYCAIGTTLDQYHSCDGFFQLKHRIITFDLSCAQKLAYKADVLITPDNEGPQMWRICADIATRLRAPTH